MWFKEFLRCPDCGSGFIWTEIVHCVNCEFQSPTGKQLILKPIHPTKVHLTFSRHLPDITLLSHLNLQRPPLLYRGPKALRDSSELISGMMPLLKSNDAVLDLGCGPRDQASVFDYIECRYVGMDFDAAQADILADAHAIPFADNTFNAVFSYAVLEHLHNPFLVFSELNRVLKPDGIFCGTVSQGEPFHNSFFHHTAWGLLTLAKFGELEILRIWPSYDTIKALALMGRYPRPLRWMMGTIDVLNRRAPFLAPRKAFGWTETERRVDELHRAGSICFLMRKSR